MRFMDEYDIETAFNRRFGHPTLGPAVVTLHNLMHYTDGHSDGWAYWPKPVRAAAKLMALIEGEGDWATRYGPRTDVTAAQVRAAYTPIKAFLTRQGWPVDQIIEEPEMGDTK